MKTYTSTAVFIDFPEDYTEAFRMRAPAKRMWYAKSVNDAQQVFRRIMGRKFPSFFREHLMGPAEVNKLLFRPGLKPYFKTGRFGARYQTVRLMHIALDFYLASRPKSGRKGRMYGDLTKEQRRLFRTKEFRYVRDLYLRPEQFKEMDTKELQRWGRRLTKQGFNMTSIKNILDGYFAQHPVRKSPKEELERRRLRNKYIRHHKGKPTWHSKTS